MNGNVRAVDALKQRLESGEEVDLLSESDSCTVASLLKRYLRDLPEGLVHSTVQQALIHLYQGRNRMFCLQHAGYIVRILSLGLICASHVPYFCQEIFTLLIFYDPRYHTRLDNQIQDMTVIPSQE